MRISDWSSDVCSSDLLFTRYGLHFCSNFDCVSASRHRFAVVGYRFDSLAAVPVQRRACQKHQRHGCRQCDEECNQYFVEDNARLQDRRSEEHTSELQSLMRISYAVFCLKKKKIK